MPGNWKGEMSYMFYLLNGNPVAELISKLAVVIETVLFLGFRT